ncbi:protein kinase domain containing protein [Babesia bovis T2Bo]|uniref:non-specific serine/threonine protein kinase n=1 Tax=Babesia bovis TaxID=5865 RepID=A7AX38_BABBO|nr:protein kinase domain containing protein [Babesia bovis T2Bo]EDO05111.1 protein kinase domain containing protein [Babesia bovis T2Bo]|eukprot:XP_001608679.1 protein kinase domain containing protein [Babesia bovis T2Bo]
MKSGFLCSVDPKVSKLSQRNIVHDETLGKRKYRLDDFEFERNIGSGNFCEVWHVTLKARPEESYALKVFNVQTVKSNHYVKSVQQERLAMIRLNTPGHTNVIRLIDTFKDDAHVYLLYEYASGGELWDEIKHVGVPDKATARMLVWQLVNGLEYIHGHGVVHRDIKCENIVIHNGMLKFIDFGTSLFLDDGQCDTSNEAHENEYRNNPSSINLETSGTADMVLPGSRMKSKFENYVGTPNFMPPEAIANINSGKAGDLWSLGCTIYQLLLGMNCYIGSSNYFIHKNVKHNRPAFPDGFDPDAKDLIEKLLVKDSHERLSLMDIRQHKYLASVPNQSFTVVPKKFDNLSVEIRRACCKIQESIFDLTIKREKVTDADYQSIEELLKWMEQHAPPAITSALQFNYYRMREQLTVEIDEANLYMRS